MRRILTLLMVLAMALVALVATVDRAAAQGPVGTFVDRMIFFEQPNAATALQDVSRGTNMQLYMFNLRTLQDKLAALGDPNVWTVQTPGSVNDLWLNPVQNNPSVGGFNPFNVTAVRRAMNWLVDRNFIISEIYGGFGIPYISPWHSKMPEYRREASHFQQLDRDFAYDPNRARTEITNAMQAQTGVSKVGGLWRYDPDGAGPEPSTAITIKFVIRIEDTRLDIGNYVAGLLENEGFTVQRDYSPAAEAFNKVYFGPPDQNVWHMYTEGFAFTALVAWQDDWIAGFYQEFSGETIWCPGGVRAPGCYAPPQALIDESNTLLNGQYTSLAERQSLIRSSSRMAVEDGVRVWIVAENAVFIYNRRIVDAVNDLMAGPWGLYTGRSVRFDSPGGTLFVGQPVHWNSQWNTFRGFTWLYDATQYRSLNDPGVYFDPHTGLPENVRARSSPGADPFAYVQTAGPTGTMPVPTDARWFNVTSGAFENVGSGLTAITKVTFDYNVAAAGDPATMGKWHDGTQITMTDMWYQLASFARREGGGDRASNKITVANTTDRWAVGDIGAVDDRADSPAVNQFLGLFKGAKETSPTTMEIYADYWHVDTATIAVTLDILPALPWHVQELQTQIVTKNFGRFDANSASSSGRTLIDLIRGATVTKMTAELGNQSTPGSVPLGMGAGCCLTPITPASANASYTALSTFRKAHNHYWVSNGPFLLDSVNVAAKQSILGRFADYPFPADKWDKFKAQVLPQVSIGTIPEVVPGLRTNIDLATTLQGAPSSDVQINYLVRNVGLKTTVLTGAPAATGTGAWRIGMDQNTTSRLIPGAHEVTVTVLGAEDLGVPVTQTRSFIVIPLNVYLERIIAQQAAEITGLRNDLTTTNTQLTQANAQIASLNSLLTVAIGVAVVGVVVSIVGVVLSLRRGSKPTLATQKTGEEL